MNKRLKVALIYPPYHHKIFEENLKTVIDEFGIYPPLNLAYAAAILEKEGHDVIIIDANALKLSKEEVLGQLRDYEPDFLGVNLHSVYAFHEGIGWLSYFKDKMPNIKTITGGLPLSDYPYEVMSHSCIDYGIFGSAHNTLLNLINAIIKGKSLKGITGITYREGKKVMIQRDLDKEKKEPENLDNLPFPARHLLPNDRYHQFISQRKNFTVMLTSIGCPCACTFCAIKLVPYNERDPIKVVDEIEECITKHNVREIDFFDAVFTLNKKRTIKICQEIKRRGLVIDWSCRSRIDSVDEELLKEMVESGCKRIYYGIESQNLEILKNIKKEIDINKVQSVIKTTQKQGIKALGFFMVGNPGESVRTIKDNVNYAKSLGLDYIQFSMTIAKPKTELDEIMVRKTGKDFWSDYILGKVDEQVLPNPWCDISTEEIKKLTSQSYRSFYFRPSIIFKTMINIKSFDELVRYIRAGLKMVF